MPELSDGCGAGSGWSAWAGAAVHKVPDTIAKHAVAAAIRRIDDFLSVKVTVAVEAGHRLCTTARSTETVTADRGPAAP